jgi:hypothetical protein
MNKQGKIVAAAFFRLSEAEQDEVLKKITETNRFTGATRQALGSIIIKEAMDLGPINTGACPYCGK